MMLKGAAVNPEATKEIDEACTCAIDPTGCSFVICVILVRKPKWTISMIFSAPSH